MDADRRWGRCRRCGAENDVNQDGLCAPCLWETGELGEAPISTNDAARVAQCERLVSGERCILVAGHGGACVKPIPRQDMSDVIRYRLARDRADDLEERLNAATQGRDGMTDQPATVADICTAILAARRAVYRLSGPVTAGLPFGAIYSHLTAAYDLLAPHRDAETADAVREGQG
jgi:hypothetical protein